MAANLEPRNEGVAYDSTWFSDIKINFPGVKSRAETIGKRRSVKKEWQAAWLLRAVTCMDLTTLSGDDSTSNVRRLCFKAQNPIRSDIVEKLGIADLNITCGAVCVYPSRVPDAKKALADANSNLPIASVAFGFPAGQTPLEFRLMEIKDAVAKGAQEIDIVLSRAHVMQGNWVEVYNEVKLARKACGDAHLKTILATGDCGSLENVYRASMVSMMAGSDFIKTSTGKEGVNAILPVALVMVRCIREYYEKTGVKVGFKPAGGIRSAKDALVWLALMKEELGDEWTYPNLFRIGASSLLVDIERQLFHHVYGRYAAAHEFPMS